MKKESQEIRKFNLKVQIELSKAIQSTKEIDVILKDFSDAHDSVRFFLDQHKSITSVDLTKIQHAIHDLFNDVKLPLQEQRIFTIISFMFISLKYQLNSEEKSEWIRGRGKVSVQKKFFEVVAKYKRDKRQSTIVPNAKKLSNYFLNLDFRTVKRVNSVLGKNIRTTEGANLAFFSRLLFEIIKANSKKILSDNEIILKMFDFYRFIYPEFNLLASDEDWLSAHSNIAIGDNFRSYQQKTIKSIIYYSNKNLFNQDGDNVTLDTMTNLIKLIQDNDSRG